jgi:hypothetical protein
MQRGLPATYSVKAALPLSSSNKQLHSYRPSIAESMGQTTDRNRARLPSLFSMKFTQVPSQYSNQFAEHTMLPNNSVGFHLIMVQRDGEKWSWITSGGHTSIGSDWHLFGVLEAYNYCQNYHWQIDIY